MTSTWEEEGAGGKRVTRTKAFRCLREVIIRYSNAKDFGGLLFRFRDVRYNNNNNDYDYYYYYLIGLSVLVCLWIEIKRLALKNETGKKGYLLNVKKLGDRTLETSNLGKMDVRD